MSPISTACQSILILTERGRLRLVSQLLFWAEQAFEGSVDDVVAETVIRP